MAVVPSSSRSSGGGSSPYAYIGTQIAAAIVNPTGGVTIAWSAADIASEGSPGFTLNADTHTWDCDTAGQYEIYVAPFWTVHGSGDGVAALCLLFATIADPNSPVNQNLNQSQTLPFNGASLSNPVGAPWTLPRLTCAPGDSFFFKAQTVNGATQTADLNVATNIQITKVA